MSDTANGLLPAVATTAHPPLVFACAPDNDLYRVLDDAGYACTRYDHAEDALRGAPEGGAVLCLADLYPRPSGELPTGSLALAAAKGLRLYIEYPAALAGTDIGPPRPTTSERLVVSSDAFAPDLEQDTILALHGCWFLPVKAAHPHLVMARVAGYSKAPYGLPDDTFPILFELPEHRAFVATSKLSQFVTGRYSPIRAWKLLWGALLRWLTQSNVTPALPWQPTVTIQAGRDDELPRDAEREAFGRSVRWFRQYMIGIGSGPVVLEGLGSEIDFEGRQQCCHGRRADCSAETAMVFASDWAVSSNPASRLLAEQILDTVWSGPDFLQDDPNNTAYGLVNWYSNRPVFYGDDNARVILSSLAAAGLLSQDRWDDQILRCLLANVRTTGSLGFRRPRIDHPSFFKDGRGWRFFRDETIVHYSPHYQAYLWAAYLWGYALTGYDGFLQPTKQAIRMMMDAFPRWRWTNGLTQELARMLLPLAFLVRIDDTPEHRGWLHRVADRLLGQMRPCGAIRELVGPRGDGDFPPPQSNQDFGKTEAPLVQENGDPCCDLLYTTNYAALGLHEAAVATGDEALRHASAQLTDFLCRIQVRSVAHSYLDGAWMRGFDDERWEYWGSSADAGWGPWSVESGWTNSWIAAVLARRHLGTTLFDRATSERLAGRLPRLLAEMWEERPVGSAAGIPVEVTGVMFD